ncbi:hypothetical protein, partial [Enterococcus faecium]|uniref:hypothetical protein n=1 Tax=Enterococcus faecium TaxID=1352 RepID=UPI002243B49A
DNRNSIRKEVLHLIKFVKKTVAIPANSPERMKRSRISFVINTINIYKIRVHLQLNLIYNIRWERQ